MELTDLQRNTLAYYKSQRHQQPTLWGMMKGSFNKNAGHAFLVAVLVAIAIVLKIPILAGAVLGYWVGKLNRDVRSYSRWVKVWAVYMEIIHWKRVDEMLGSNTKSGQAN
ncbi:MAG: hypothetical protein QGF00_03035 [Planctomycetota bacterium]|jgi:hypothetical protein|nr:hypothetical protein [Planctomycetota bacterium]MDP7248552.1 hypothetical protein [Planctomycetota bacterium]